MFENIMIDIETLSTEPDAAIISVGACEFCLETGEIGREFYMPVDLESALEGRHVSAGTLKWWFERAELFNRNHRGGSHVNSVLIGLASFINAGSLEINPYVWSKPDTFDIVILESAFKKASLNLPWDHRRVHNAWTIAKIAEGIVSPDDQEFIGEPHNALDDAKNQAHFVSEAWRALREGRGNKYAPVEAFENFVDK